MIIIYKNTKRTSVIDTFKTMQQAQDFKNAYPKVHTKNWILKDCGEDTK